ncbi:MAG: DNA polymerase III subunit delta [Oscillospiraceae bacterium]
MLSEKNLNDMLKNDINKNIALIGNQNFLIEKYLKLILVSIKKQKKFFEKIDIDFESTDINYINDVVTSVGFFDSVKLILIKNVDINNMKKSDIEKLGQVLRGTDNTIILTSKAFEDKKKLEYFNESFGSDFDIFNLVSYKKDDNIKFIKNSFKKSNIEIGTFEAEYIYNNTYSNMNFLVNEIDKLASYKKGGVIKKEDIDVLSCKTVEQNIFLLLDFILKKQIENALNLVTYLIDLGESEISILSALTMGFLDMYRYKLNSENGGDLNFLVSAYGYKKSDFRLKKASWYIDKVTLKQLDNIIKAIYKCEKNMKSKSGNLKIFLEVLILNIFNIYTGNIR